MNRISVIILAAGKGQRMKSHLPKVLHCLAGRPLLHHVLSTASEIDVEKQIVVLGPEMEEVANTTLINWPNLQFALQSERLGTGHALKVAEQSNGGFSGDILVLYGDVPLLTARTLENLISSYRNQKADIAILSFRPKNPKGYGRIVSKTGNTVLKVVEQEEATQKEQEIKICNSGIFIGNEKVLCQQLTQLNANNSKGEYFVTDIFSHAAKAGHKCIHLEVEDNSEVLGINDQIQLAEAEAVIQSRLRLTALESGVSMVDPSTVWLCWDTKLAKDVTIEPNVVFGSQVSVEAGAQIRAFCHLEGVNIGKGAVIGPFARLRPDTVIGKDAKIGNFVEIKKSIIGDQTKVNHLSYIGDTNIGNSSNIGAGTITCNYDGYQKSQTKIGNDVLIGSNSSLIAPIEISDRAVVGAGSVLTENVSADSIVVSRSKQVENSGAATRRRQREKKKPDDS